MTSSSYNGDTTISVGDESSLSYHIRQLCSSERFESKESFLTYFKTHSIPSARAAFKASMEAWFLLIWGTPSGRFRDTLTNIYTSTDSHPLRGSSDEVIEFLGLEDSKLPDPTEEHLCRDLVDSMLQAYRRMLKCRWPTDSIDTWIEKNTYKDAEEFLEKYVTDEDVEEARSEAELQLHDELVRSFIIENFDIEDLRSEYGVTEEDLQEGVDISPERVSIDYTVGSGPYEGLSIYDAASLEVEEDQAEVERRMNDIVWGLSLKDVSEFLEERLLGDEFEGCTPTLDRLVDESNEDSLLLVATEMAVPARAMVGNSAPEGLKSLLKSRSRYLAADIIAAAAAFIDATRLFLGEEVEHTLDFIQKVLTESKLVLQEALASSPQAQGTHEEEDEDDNTRRHQTALEIVEDLLQHVEDHSSSEYRDTPLWECDDSLREALKVAAFGFDILPSDEATGYKTDTFGRLLLGEPGNDWMALGAFDFKDIQGGAIEWLCNLGLDDGDNAPPEFVDWVSDTAVPIFDVLNSWLADSGQNDPISDEFLSSIVCNIQDAPALAGLEANDTVQWLRDTAHKVTDLLVSFGWIQGSDWHSRIRNPPQWVLSTLARLRAHMTSDGWGYLREYSKTRELALDIIKYCFEVIRFREKFREEFREFLDRMRKEGVSPWMLFGGPKYLDVSPQEMDALYRRIDEENDRRDRNAREWGIELDDDFIA